MKTPENAKHVYARLTGDEKPRMPMGGPFSERVLQSAAALGDDATATQATTPIHFPTIHNLLGLPSDLRGFPVPPPAPLSWTPGAARLVHAGIHCESRDFT